MPATGDSITNPIGCDVIVNDVNCVGISNGDQATALDAAFPENQTAYRKAFDAGEVLPGHVFYTHQRGEANKWILNFVSRVHFNTPLDLKMLEKSAARIVEESIRRTATSVAIREMDLLPEESFSQVKLAFLTAFARVPNIKVSFFRLGMQSPRKQVVIFTDGGAEPNPGVGGYGVVLRFGDAKKELSAGFKRTTNNRMELLAVIVALEELKEECSVTIYSDSKYVVDAINDGGLFRWRANNWKNGKVINIDLWQRFLDVYLKHEASFIWVKGHAGIADNERCDQLASLAIASNDLADDQGYPESLQSTAGSTVTKQATKKIASKSPRKRGRKPKKEGDPCRYCNVPLIKRQSKKKKLKSGQRYYYQWNLRCPGCERIFLVDEAKVRVVKTADDHPEVN